MRGLGVLHRSGGLTTIGRIFRYLSTFEEILRQEQNIGGPLRQAAHEVWIPLRAERHVDAYPEALGDEFALQVAPNPIQLSLIHISEPTRQAEISYAVF